MEKLLTTEEAAELLGITANTLAKYRVRANGPTFVKLGKGRNSHIRYKPKALEDWLIEARSTSELAPA